MFFTQRKKNGSFKYIFKKALHFKCKYDYTLLLCNKKETSKPSVAQLGNWCRLIAVSYEV